MKLTTELSARESALYSKFIGRDVDVDIDVLYVTAYPNRLELNATERQRYVGAFITRINRKVKGRGEEIKPGQLKRTYRLTAIPA